MTGGYQMVSLKNYNFTLSTPHKIDNVYDLIEGTKKPILLCDIVVGGKEQNDLFCEAVVSGSNFVITTKKYTITISSQDEVTITEIGG